MSGKMAYMLKGEARSKYELKLIKVLVQVDAIVKLLSTTELSFVFCVLPHNLAGLCELFKKPPGKKLNQKLVRDQVTFLK